MFAETIVGSDGGVKSQETLHIRVQSNIAVLYECGSIALWFFANILCANNFTLEIFIYNVLKSGTCHPQNVVSWCGQLMCLHKLCMCLLPLNGHVISLIRSCAYTNSN